MHIDIILFFFVCREDKFDEKKFQNLHFHLKNKELEIENLKQENCDQKLILEKLNKNFKLLHDENENLSKQFGNLNFDNENLRNRNFVLQSILSQNNKDNNNFIPLSQKEKGNENKENLKTNVNEVFFQNFGNLEKYVRRMLPECKIQYETYFEILRNEYQNVSKLYDASHAKELIYLDYLFNLQLEIEVK